jgi:hypothetical protein
MGWTDVARLRLLCLALLTTTGLLVTVAFTHGWGFTMVTVTESPSPRVYPPKVGVTVIVVDVTLLATAG